jgi:twitching motility protein PilT
MQMSTNKIESINKLNQWLRMLIDVEGADLHIKTDGHIRARVKDNIVLLSTETVTKETINDLIMVLTAEKYDDFMETKEFDGGYSLDQDYRFRVNIFMHIDGYGIAMRLIPSYIRNIEELNLPSALHKLSNLKRGLVLITGTTGSGKSTTLASIIEEINRNYPYHIITIEDPVEYIHKDKKSIIEQRELGQHTRSFSRALRAAMREDPDIIVVGEIRDMATAESILQAVNTGHLVFSTIHTLDARETIDRLIAIFPTSEQNRVRDTLASTLEAVISQRLLLGENGTMIPAVEMLFKSPQIQELIRKNRDHEIPDALEKETISYESQTFNRALFTLTLQNKITEQQALEYASSPADLNLMFTMSDEYQEKVHQNEVSEVMLKENI